LHCSAGSERACRRPIGRARQGIIQARLKDYLWHIDGRDNRLAKMPSLTFNSRGLIFIWPYQELAQSGQSQSQNQGQSSQSSQGFSWKTIVSWKSQGKFKETCKKTTHTINKQMKQQMHKVMDTSVHCMVGAMWSSQQKQSRSLQALIYAHNCTHI
jgi:hypothetical protein